MASIIYNPEHVLQSAIAAAFAVTDVTPIAKADESLRGDVYVFDDEPVNDEVTLKKLIGTIPIAQLGTHSVPKEIITFLNKHSADIMAVYLGMLETDEYARLYPFPAFFRLFGSLDFDVRWGAKFIRRAMIRDRHANHLAAEIPALMYKGALFIRYGPYIERRVAAEKEKEDAPESIVVFCDNTGFSNGAEVSMRLIVHGKIPGCLSEVSFEEIEDGPSVGSMSLSSWASMMKNAKVDEKK